MSYKILRNDNFSEIARYIVSNEIQAESKIGFYSEVNLNQIEKIRESYGVKGLLKPSYTAFVVKAASQVLANYPQYNKRLFKRIWWPFGAMHVQQFEHVDIAVQVEKVLKESETATFVDIIRMANKNSLSGINSWLKMLVESTIENNQQWRLYYKIVQLLPFWLAKILISLPLISTRAWSQYRGGSLLVNSPAKYGVDFIVGTWTWPLTVSFGLVKLRPKVIDNEVVACPTFNLILSFDRRIIAGAQAARFFKDIVNYLENFDESLAENHENTCS